MDGIILIILLLVGWAVIGPIAALISAGNARREAAEAKRRAEELTAQLLQFRRELREAQAATPAPPPDVHRAMPPLPAQVVPAPEAESTAPEVVPLVAEPLPVPVAEILPAATPPPPLPIPLAPPAVPAVAPVGRVPAEPAEEVRRQPLNLEQFMGVKLFAWLGGVALFFGIIFFVKYAFENNLVSPAMQIALGYLTGAGVLAGGMVLQRRGTHPSLSHSFCATGILVIYGVTYAAYALERYQFLSQAGAFLLMALTTLAAFLIAVRLHALVVAVLGLVGGFLTPVLVATGKDELFILTVYVALLCGGLAAVSRHRSWAFLTTAAAVGALLHAVGWFAAHFVAGSYGKSVAVLQPMGALLLLQAVFLAAVWRARRGGRDDWHADLSALLVLLAGWPFAFLLLGWNAVAQRMEWIFGWVAVQMLAVMALAWLRPRLLPAQLAATVLVFVHLAVWTGIFLNPGNLISALALYLGFGAFTTVVPMFQLRRLSAEESPALPARTWPFAALGPLLLGLVCLLRLPEPALVVWTLVLPANLLVAALAARSGTVLPVATGLLVTLVMAVAWLFRAPVVPGSLGPMLGITLGSALFFATLGLWLGRRFATADDPNERAVAAALPALAGALPFGLLMLATDHLQPVAPGPVFGAALLLAALLLGWAVVGRMGVLVPCAAAGVLLVQAVWHGTALDTVSPWLPLGWYGGCYLLFLLFPFVFQRVFAGSVLPWISSALAGVAWFLLIHPLVKHSFLPVMTGRLGLVPLAFALPSMLALLRVVRMAREMDAVQRSRLAWFGGVALLFITLVFPIQFERQWLTISWALEGALLLWLFRRVPHFGLQLTGLALLGTAFVRLALNPAVWTDYARAATPVFNWYLYTYGLVALALFAGALWFSDPDGRLSRWHPRGVLFALCGILVFILLNLEIADFFTPEGETRVSLGGAGNFARDMTYSIAWGIYALLLLVIGIWRGVRPARYAAIGLLGITLLKLFLVDLAALRNIYRIGALIGVAVIAFIASFLYQQFFNRAKSR